MSARYSSPKRPSSPRKAPAKKASPKKAASPAKKRKLHVGAGAAEDVKWTNWSAVQPRGKKARQALAARCGADNAFLLPDPAGVNHKFPVIPADGPCRPVCAGVRAASIRAKQHGYKQVAADADALADELGCPYPRERKAESASALGLSAAQEEQVRRLANRMSKAELQRDAGVRDDSLTKRALALRILGLVR